MGKNILLLVYLVTEKYVYTPSYNQIDFSVPQGGYDNGFILERSTEMPTGVVRYAPSVALPYSSPITLNTIAIIRTVAFTATDPTFTKPPSYLFLDARLSSDYFKVPYLNDPMHGIQTNYVLSSLSSLYSNFIIVNHMRRIGIMSGSLGSNDWKFLKLSFYTSRTLCFFEPKEVTDGVWDFFGKNSS